MTSLGINLTHIAILATYVFTIYCTFFVLDLPSVKRTFVAYDPGQLKYLTVWNLILQAVFFLVCLLNDIFGSNAVGLKKRPFIRQCKDYFHAALGFPVAMFVGITFWGLMFVDRELVLPKALDPYFPWWLNHLMHTAIMVFTTLELILAPRQYPTRSNGLTGLVVFNVIYLVWMHIVYHKSGVWVYPVMDVLSLPLRIIFFLVLLAFSCSLYFAGEALDRIFWGKRYLEAGNSSELKA